VAADFQKGPPIRVASLSASSGGYSESDETDESFDSQSEEQESDGNDSDSDGSMVLRRSTRFEKKRRVKILPFSPRTRRFRYVHASDDSDDAYSSTASKVQKKKRNVVRGKASRPAYGRFRVVADLEYDEISDEETAPLRVHRGVCEKCHRKPAHELLEMERKKPTKKLKKKKEDEFADSGDEEEKVTALGGWVRWFVALRSVCPYILLTHFSFSKS
jgi:hypothetical protein